MTDADVGRFVLRWFADNGRSPTLDELRVVAGDPHEAKAALRRLEADHVVVLDDAGASVRMALPFSGVPTDFIVRRGERSWFANCAWDALAIPTALHAEATIHSHWADTGDELVLEVSGDGVAPSAGYIGFVVPARHWWDDVVFT